MFSLSRKITAPSQTHNNFLRTSDSLLSQFFQPFLMTADWVMSVEEKLAILFYNLFIFIQPKTALSCMSSLSHLPIPSSSDTNDLLTIHILKYWSKNHARSMRRRWWWVKWGKLTTKNNRVRKKRTRKACCPFLHTHKFPSHIIMIIIIVKGDKFKFLMQCVIMFAYSKKKKNHWNRDNNFLSRRQWFTLHSHNYHY